MNSKLGLSPGKAWAKCQQSSPWGERWSEEGPAERGRAEESKEAGLPSKQLCFHLLGRELL